MKCEQYQKINEEKSLKLYGFNLHRKITKMGIQKIEPFYISPNEAGCDEAGRGCLSGPVVAAAVILGGNFNHKDLNDSKKLTASQRKTLKILIEKNAEAYAVAFVGPNEIDEINILNASFLAMHKAVNKLLKKPSYLLIDGNRFRPYPNLKHFCIVKGDAKFQNIAAASILAKTYRDEYMQSLAKEFPQYGWERNKGYPTKQHRLAIIEHGTTPHHRKSFRLKNEQLQLF